MNTERLGRISIQSTSNLQTVILKLPKTASFIQENAHPPTHEMLVSPEVFELQCLAALKNSTCSSWRMASTTQQTVASARKAAVRIEDERDSRQMDSKARTPLQWATRRLR